MKIPRRPPGIVELFKRFPNNQDDPERFVEFMNIASSIESRGEYLHWDKLRFKSKPENFTLEEYWLAIKMNRNSTRKYLPFMSIEGQNPGFHFTRPDCLLAALRDIDMRTGGMVTSSEEAIGRSDGQKYLTRSIMEEPFSSSVLEGAAVTRSRAKAMIEKGEAPRTRDDQMVVNNYRGMMFIKDHINSDLTPELILECHKIITEGTLDRSEMAGKLRDNNDVEVGDEFTGEVYHIPPKFTELAGRLSILCDFANQKEDPYYIHPVTKAIIIHFILAFDHPFVDGNGRTARALFYWFMLKSGYWLVEYISISKIIKEAPIQYGRAFLYTETDDNDVTYFIMHQLKVIERAISEIKIYLDRQKYKNAKVKKFLSDEDLNRRQTDLLINLIRQTVFEVTISEHEKLAKVSYLTARKDLEGLVFHGWLKKNLKGRKAYYKASAKLESLQ